MLPPTPTQLYLVSIRFQRKISFVTSFTISNWLKKYYFSLPPRNQAKKRKDATKGDNLWFIVGYNRKESNIRWPDKLVAKEPK